MSVTHSWNKRVKFSISNTNIFADQSNFPVALVWNGSIGNVPPEFYNSGSLSPQSDGRDIRFTLDSNGTSELPFEIVTYTPSSTEANARVEIYTKLPVLYSTVDTTFFGWWGNSDATAYAVTDPYGRNAVWSGYLAVYHMDNFSNATGNTAYDGTNFGTDATFTPLGTARYFDSSARDYVGIAGLMGNPTTLTVSSYINAMGADTFGSEIYSIGDYMATRCTAGNVLGFYHYASGWNNTSLTVPAYFNEFHTVSYTSDPGGSDQNMFFDDSDATMTTFSDALVYTGAGSNTFIGRHGNGSADFDFTGIIDEIRVSNQVRPQSWINASHYSLNHFSDFVSDGSTQIVSSLPDRGWNRRVKLTIPGSFISADLTNFPVMLLWNGTSGNLPAEVYSNSSLSPKSDGRDIRFSVDFDGNSEIPFEVVTFSPNSTVSSARAEIHVKMPSLYTSTDATFFMWWGHGTAAAYDDADTLGRNNVWTNSYVGVWHLNDVTGTTAINSVGQLNGTYDGTSFPNRVDTSYGYAQKFINANANNINIGNSSVTDITGSMSISAVIKVDTFTSVWQAIVAKGDSAYRLHRYNDTTYCSFGRSLAGGGGIDASCVVNVNDGSYHHLLGRYNSGVGTQLAIDGTIGALDSNTTFTATNTSTLRIGRNTDYAPGRDWSGNIAEVRLQSASRSNAWIAAEYNNLMNFSNFVVADYVNNVDFSEIGCNF
jgi:hypothetical protein